MSTFKKLLALTLALAMVLSVSAFAGNYKDNTYADAAAIDKDCEDSVELMYALDIMKGDDKGNFNPNATITRAEMAKMIYVVLNYGKDDKAVTYVGGKIFSDVPAGAWYEGYVNYCGMTKLVQGRGDGTFGPNDPITAAAAAKMLLTAIGYSAEGRNYVGANWDKNVLSDAAIIGLLKGYNYPTNTYAPRQWIAVMFENALTDAYTYGTIRPEIFNGLITGTTIPNTTYLTMGEKYYNLDSFTSVLIATDKAYVDQYQYEGADTKVTTDDKYTTFADGLLFANGKDVRNTNLGYMDLGQEYRVIYNTKNDKVYSINPTGESLVADALLKDIEFDNSYATDKNDAKNKYVFTFGDMEAKFDTFTINKLVVSTKTGISDGFAKAPITANELKQDAGKLTADNYRAVDSDGDGDVDYMIITEYDYAAIKEVKENNYYGKYFTAKGVDGKDYKPLRFTGTRWIIDDIVATDDELEAGNYVKVTFNPDEWLYDVEVLPVAEEVEFEKRTSKEVYTIAGEEYMTAVNGFEEAASTKVLVSKNVGEKLNIVVDGDLVVYAEKFESNLSDLADINAQLVMVTEAYVDLYSNPAYNEYFVEYMTIDGEMHKDRLYAGKWAEGYVSYADLVGDKTPADYASGKYNANAENHQTDWSYLDNHQRLFKFHESSDGVKLQRLQNDSIPGGKDQSKDILNYSTTLLNGYHDVKGKLDTEDNTFKNDFVAEENLFFVSDKNDNFAVMSLNDMGEGADTAAFLQGLYKNSKSEVYKTYLAGHIYVNLDLSAAKGYLYTTEEDGLYETTDGMFLTGVVFNDGAAEEDIEVSMVNGAAADVGDVKANCLYAYTYAKENGEKVYQLTLVDETTAQNTNGYNFDYDVTALDAKNAKPADGDKATANEIKLIQSNQKGDMIYFVDNTNFELDAKNIVLKTIELKREQNQDDTPAAPTTDKLKFVKTNETIEFVEFDALAESNYANGTIDDTYYFYSDYYYVDGNIFYLINYEVMDEANVD